jgi:hypothetical protein
MYTHFRGSTFQFIGQMQDDGVPYDLTNCTLQASVYGSWGNTLFGALTVDVFNPTQGMATISYPDTSGWPVGKARIDFMLYTANGETIMSPPDWFRIAESPLGP